MDDVGRIRYQISPVIESIHLEDETITDITTYENNLYVGTSNGQLLHFHRFDDTTEYIPITTINVGTHSVSKILCIESIQRLLVISNRIVLSYVLPELSPCRMKKMKDVTDLQKLDSLVLVLSPTKIRIINIQADTITLAKEINYQGGVACRSCKDSNFIVVANNESYDIIDLDNNRKVPLFSYKSESTVHPWIIPFDGEYLLSVLSDTNTSMAMFINSVGDVTRGTLTWVDKGYPENSIALEGEYVFALFKNKMIVSSLVSLDTVLEMENPGYTITKVPPAIVNDKSLANIIDTIQPTASLILTNGKQIFGLHKVHKLVEIQQQFINDSLTELNPASYTGNARDYITYLALVQAVITKNDDKFWEFANQETNEQLVVSPQFVFYILGGGEKHLPFPGLKEICQHYGTYKNDKLLKKYIQGLPDKYLSTDIKLYYYQNCTNEEGLAFTERVTFEDNPQPIIDLLIHQHRIKCASEVYKKVPLLIEYNTFINKHLLDSLVDDAVALLLSGKLDENEYSKTLISLLKFDDKRGIGVLKNGPSKYYNINQTVMKDLSETTQDEKGYLLLRIELMEITENSSEELLQLIVQAMNLLYDSLKDEFTLLHQEFRRLNSLENERWPKLSWPNFLDISGKSKELLTFVELYLKSFELAREAPDGPIFDYHRMFNNHDIDALLEFGDYSTAESIATGTNPFPKKTFYGTMDFTSQPSTTGLIQILNFYLTQYSSGKQVENTIKHFAEAYYHTIAPWQFLQLIPPDFPLAHLVGYFHLVTTDQTQQYRDVLIRKSRKSTYKKTLRCIQVATIYSQTQFHTKR